jgi:hypothetical protein
MRRTAYGFPLVLKKKSNNGSSINSGQSTPGGTANGRTASAEAKRMLSEGDLAKADAALSNRACFPLFASPDLTAAPSLMPFSGQYIKDKLGKSRVALKRSVCGHGALLWFPSLMCIYSYPLEGLYAIEASSF